MLINWRYLNVLTNRANGSRYFIWTNLLIQVERKTFKSMRSLYNALRSIQYFHFIKVLFALISYDYVLLHPAVFFHRCYKANVSVVQTRKPFFDSKEKKRKRTHLKPTLELIANNLLHKWLLRLLKRNRTTLKASSSIHTCSRILFWYLQ